MLERLSPEERSAFLLRKAFDMDYREIASALGKTEVACRKIVSRASTRVQEGERRYDVSKDEHRDVLTNFMHAAATGNPAAMQKVIVTKAEPVIANPYIVLSFALIRRGPASHNQIAGTSKTATWGNVSVPHRPTKVWPASLCLRRVPAIPPHQI
jgi:RNA polymerase sigma-70 factor (ECF subfamily)